MTCIPLDKAHSLFQGNFSVQIVENLPVAHRLKGLAVAIWEQGTDLIDQPGFHHGKDPGIYSRIEFFAGAVEPDLLDDKIPLLPAARLEGRERPAGDKAALEGTDDPLRIADVDL